MKKPLGFLRTLHDRINYRGMVEQKVVKHENRFRSYSFDQFYAHDESDTDWWSATIGIEGEGYWVTDSDGRTHHIFEYL